MNKKKTNKTKKISKISRGGTTSMGDFNSFLQIWCNELIFPNTDGTIGKIKDSYLLYFTLFKEYIENNEEKLPTIINLINENIDIINSTTSVIFTTSKMMDNSSVDKCIAYAKKCLYFIQNKIKQENVVEIYNRIRIFEWCLKYTPDTNVPVNPIYETLHYLVNKEYTQRTNEKDDKYISYKQLNSGYPILQGYLLLYTMIIDKLSKKLKKMDIKNNSILHLQHLSIEITNYIKRLLKNLDNKKYHLVYKLPLIDNQINSLVELNNYIKLYSYSNTNGIICELSRSKCFNIEQQQLRLFGKIQFTENEIGVSVTKNQDKQLQIISCNPNSIAEKKGIIINDIIQHIYIDGKNILNKNTTMNEIYKILKDTRPITLKIMRKDINMIDINQQSYDKCNLLSNKCKKSITR